MAEHRFSLTRCSSAVYIPPVYSRSLWKMANRLERIGQWLGLFFGGVLLVEAQKQVYGAIQQPAVLKKSYRPQLEPVPSVVGRS
jgi:hypothetical protein